MLRLAYMLLRERAKRSCIAVLPGLRSRKGADKSFPPNAVVGARP